MASTEESFLIGEDIPLEENRIESIFEAIAIKKGNENEVAIIENDKSITYNKLYYKTNILASYLYNELDKKSDRIVGIFMEISINSIISILAVFQIGGTYVPLDPKFPKKRLEYILEKSNIGCILTSTSQFTLLKSYQIYLPIFDVDVILQHSAEVNPKLKSSRQHENLPCLIFTSGSTGNLKGVRLSHSNLLNRFCWQWRMFPFVQEDRVSAMKSLTFIDSLTEFLPALLKGILIIIVPSSIKNNPKELLHLFSIHNITRIVIVPTLLNMILTYISTDPNMAKDVKINLWISSGEVLTKNILFKFFQYFSSSTIVNYYGSTEVTGDVTSKTINLESFKEMDEIVPIGKPIDNTAIYILNENQDLVKHTEYGEICVSGLNVSAGYQDNPSDKFIANPFKSITNDKHEILYRTGDYGYIQDGDVYYIGRVDNQIKIRGVKVHLSEIEMALESISFILQSVICCINRESNPELICFCVVQQDRTDQEIIEILKTNLASEMIPRIVIKKELPVLVSGKVDKLSLVKEYQKSYNKTKSSHEIFQIISDVLHLNIDENNRGKTFYELGGTSFNAIEALARLRLAGYSVQNPTILRIFSLNELEGLKKDSICFPDVINTGNCYRIEQLSEKTSFGDVAKVIGESFVNKNILDIIIKSTVEDHVLLMERLWNRLIEEKYSFLVRNKVEDIIGVMLNTDFFNEPEAEIPERLLPIHRMHEVLEDSSRKKLKRSESKWMHSIMLGTALSLSSADNAQLVIYMEKELLKFAQSLGFGGVFTINSSKITQVICEEMLGYQVMEKLKVQNYEYNGKKVFEEAPPDIILFACCKYL